MNEVITDRELARRVGNGERPTVVKIGHDRWRMTRPRLYFVEQPRDYPEPFVFVPSHNAPDLYESLAAESLPDSGPISLRDCDTRVSTPSRGTVARKATDLLAWVTIVVCLLILVSGSL